jgi:DNA-binding TFAR19-related protein (PDSD5 family)
VKEPWAVNTSQSRNALTSVLSDALEEASRCRLSTVAIRNPSLAVQRVMQVLKHTYLESVTDKTEEVENDVTLLRWKGPDKNIELLYNEGYTFN